MYIYIYMFSIYVDIALNIYMFNNNKHGKPYYFFTMHNKFINYNKSA